MLRRYNNLGIAKKILAMLLLVSILPIMCIQLLSYAINTTTIRNQTKELIITGLEQSARSVDDLLADFDRIVMEIYTDSDYADQMEAINTWESRSYYTAKYEIAKRLQNIAYVNRDILGIAIVGINGDTVFYDSVTMSSTVSYCFDLKQIGRSGLYRDSLSQKRTLYSPTIYKKAPGYGERHYFYMAHQLTDFNNYKKGPLGCIILCVDEGALSGAYQKAGSNESNITFATNDTGDILSFPDKRFIGMNIFDEAGEPPDLQREIKRFFIDKGILATGRMEVNSRSIRDGRFLIINVQDLGYILKNVWYITAIILLIGFLAGCVCVVIALNFAGMIDYEVKKIISAMQCMASGNYGVHIDVEGNDEFAQISNHFNDMIRKIVNANQQERNAILRRKNAEINLLEAQINPHFLYNTLDAINWLAIEREQFKISKMLTSLAMILRHSIHRSNEIVTIASEIEYIKKYIFLQQQRFHYSFQCVIDAEDDVLDFRIHKLLIQPLIENAIIHGFPGNTNADEINICIRRQSEDLMKLTVADNGHGMPKELVERFNTYDYNGQKQEKSIGVYNVITRLQLYYGERSSFRVDSGEGGTVITICIPLE